MNEDYEFDLKNKQLLPFPLSSSEFSITAQTVIISQEREKMLARPSKSLQTVEFARKYQAEKWL